MVKETKQYVLLYIQGVEIFLFYLNYYLKIILFLYYTILSGSVQE